MKILFFLLLSVNIIAQKTVNAEIILKTNDTMQVELLLPFYPTLNKIPIKKKSIEIFVQKEDIKQLEYTYFNGNKILFRDDGNGLIQILFDGKKNKMFSTFTSLGSYNNVYSEDYIENYNKEVYKINIFRKKTKEYLKTIAKGNLEIIELIDSTKLSNELIVDILKKLEDKQ